MTYSVLKSDTHGCGTLFIMLYLHGYTVKMNIGAKDVISMRDYLG